MRDESQRVITPCPRCGRASAWAVDTRGGVEAREVADQPGICALSRDQWADRAEQAEAVMAGRAG
jgi:hypothetical protein